MAMLALLKRMERDDLTVHGFRSTSGIGLRSVPTIRAMSPRWPWPMRSGIRSKPLTGAAIFSTSGGA